ncbi:MAG: cytidylate kinase family protein [Candidatus Paceibacterota bacterium]|jgi:cytidylate kinase
MKKQIITINGFPGSGKSSTADKVAKELGFKRFSSGDFMRNIALKRGVSLNELSLLAEKEENIDIEIDNEVRKAGEGNNLVIDSRLAFHWIPESFKVYLDLPTEIAKERIANNLKTNKLRQESEGHASVEEIYEKITKRLESEKKRYMELYKVDHTDKNNFDLVIDTNKNNLEQVVAIIVAEYKNWQEKS